MLRDGGIVALAGRSVSAPPERGRLQILGGQEAGVGPLSQSFNEVCQGNFEPVEDAPQRLASHFALADYDNGCKNLTIVPSTMVRDVRTPSRFSLITS